MALFRFSRRAEGDLLSIGAYTLRMWGQEQATRYIDDLEACCQMLADNAAVGRRCDDVRPGCAEWRAAGMLCFTARRPEASWFFASCTGACFLEDTRSTMTRAGPKDKSRLRSPFHRGPFGDDRHQLSDSAFFAHAFWVHAVFNTTWHFATAAITQSYS